MILPSMVREKLPADFETFLKTFLQRKNYDLFFKNGMIYLARRNLDPFCDCVDTPRFWWYLVKYQKPTDGLNGTIGAGEKTASEWAWLIVRAMVSCGGRYINPIETEFLC